MEDFYFYASIVALIILIIILTLLGITISYGNTTKRYPRNASQCPDYWTVSGDYCLYPLTTSYTNRGSSDFIGGGSSMPGGEDLATLGNLGSIAYYGSTNYSGITLTNTNLISTSTNNGQFAVRLNNNDASWNTVYPGVTPRCGKRKWALESGIVWDGVTNYNGCGDPAN